jgi:four helix bundle protein
MSDSRNLRVLDAAEDLAAAVFEALERVDARRAPGVRGQLVRAASSVAANIAEAANLGSDANFKRQLRLSLASANEAGSHLRILRRTGAMDPLAVARCDTKRRVVCKMLTGLIRRIEEDEAKMEDERRRRTAGGRQTGGTGRIARATER